MKIKKGNWVLVMLFSFFIINAANAQNDQVGSAALPSEGEMLVIINAFNQNEINISEMVQKRQVSFSVMEYAQMLHKQHSENMTRASELLIGYSLPASGNEMSEEILQKGSEELNSLNARSEGDFETAYLDAMISGHTKVVDMIDGWLNAGLSNEQIKNYLMDTRSHVQHHLEEARKLR